MTSKKQVAANQANSKKSTGAKTEQGKQAVSLNAVKHGIFSSRLVMPFESADEYGQLLDGLIDSLNPTGSVEQLLVEKVAVAMWRQLRRTKAESAGIEMNRSIYKQKIRSQVQDMTSDGYSLLDVADFSPITAEGVAQVKWCKVVLAEFEKLDDDLLNDVEHIKTAPEIMKQLMSEAKEDEHATVKDYINELSGDLENWVREIADWCEKEVSKIELKKVKSKAINEALEMVQAKESSPVSNQLLIRYQAALDSELYKALAALRKQQEWRLKSGDLIESVVV
ncbi:MAG: hypothetical protein DRI65_08525 [Chloroflexota bacterium]|nr:MAG: hypothetical protein DRI65_08525 [Chloroflexota bacterium]